MMTENNYQFENAQRDPVKPSRAQNLHMSRILHEFFHSYWLRLKH